MVKSKRIATAATGVLGGLALLAFGAVQAVGAENPGTCTEGENGQVRCAQVSEYRVTETDNGVRIDNETSQSCSGKGELTCASNLVVS
ncbi:hypothetical protein AB0N20_24805 [Streptomyces griseoincarnatus]